MPLSTALEGGKVRQAGCHPASRVVSQKTCHCATDSGLGRRFGAGVALLRGVPDWPDPAVIHFNLLPGEGSEKSVLLMFRSILSAGLLAMALQVGAQSYVHQVLVLNEGYFDYFDTQEQLVPVTLGSYDPATGTYQTVATLEGPRFGTDVLVHDGSIYVAADDRIYRFDLETHAQVAVAEVVGVRKLAVWNDLLLLTRGELGGLPHYFEARDINSLVFLDAITPADGLPFSAEDVLVVGDLAYLAVSNAFEWGNLQGRVGIVDLPSMTYGAEVDLGPDGLNPEKLMLHQGDIIAFNNKDFTGSSISRVSTATQGLAYTTNVSVNSGCAASLKVEANDQVYFLEYAQGELARFDLATGAVSDTLPGSPDIYGLIEDPINGVLYATTTDYFSMGDLHVLDLDGNILSTVAVGVAPGNMALDVRASTGITSATKATFGLYPNPAMERITFSGELPEGAVAIRIMDATGRLVHEEVRALAPGSSLAVDALRPGLYTLQLNGDRPVRFTKQ
jgi:hypothetical protein